MKRRGTSRRQVLELDASSSSLKASWQTKYQQICLEHVGKSSSPSADQNGSDEENAQLPKLVGYTSDSEDEDKTDKLEDKTDKLDLDSKVEDFLKEISDITSEEPTNELKSGPLNPNVTKPTEKSKVSSKNTKRKVKSRMTWPAPLGEQVTNLESNTLQPTIAWQECYDEGSGCYYYWNTETNEVTWEIPQEMRAYQIALEQWNAQQLLFSQQGSGGIASAYVKQSQQQQYKKLASNKAQEKVKNNKRTKPNSDSEDEKIELITSYGPTSDDEDSDSDAQSINSSKKKKADNYKTAKKAPKENVAIGPQLPPGYILPVEEKKSEPKPVTKDIDPNVVNHQRVTVQKPDSKIPKTASKTDVGSNLKKDVVSVVSSQNDKEKISALQRLRSLKNRDSEDSSDSEESSGGETNKENDTKDIQDDEEEDDDVEDSILERLKDQAKILQELGGEIPDEIKKLISKSTSEAACFSPDKPKDSRGDAPIFDIPEESQVAEKTKHTVETPKEESNQFAAEKIQSAIQENPSISMVKKPVLTNINKEKVNVDLENEEDYITEVIDEEQKSIEVVKKTHENYISNTDKLVNESETIVIETRTESDNEIQTLENDIEMKSIIDDTKIESDVNDFKTRPVVNNIENDLNSTIEPAVVENNLKLDDSGIMKDGIIIREKAPTSFSLIAGYGNEEDSEGEEDKLDEKLKENEKATPLFPIVGSEKVKVPTKNKKIIKLSAKAKELIHSSTTTEKARATDFVSTADGLRPSGSVFKESEDMLNAADSKHDLIEPVKKVSRKKRLEMPAIGLIKQAKASLVKTSDNSNVEQVEDKASDSSVKVQPEKLEAVMDYTNAKAGYNKTWAYNSELRGGEYRGFGYGHDHNTDQVVATTSASKMGKIQFIKAETLMPKNEPVVCVKEDKPSEDVVKEEDEPYKIETDKANELTQVISEKVKFLCEGKETVPPVQVMAIQLEMLSTAMAAGGLTVSYMLGWLQSVDTQLASLEQAAAPLGWQCHWDRTYKRYYYRNDETGATQWDYPNEQTAQGGEEAMELCDSPPPLPPATAPPPLPPVSPPHPPLSLPPAAPPPPRISSRSPSPTALESDKAPAPPPPPVISDQPPLPPLPPSPPPPPPPPIISSLAHGEPLPPGVDMPEELYNNQPPLPPEPVEPVYSVGYEVPVPYDPFQMQPIADYNGGVYHPGAMFNTGGGEAYVIARPPASVPVPPPSSSPCLASELDSFYNEVAALEPAPPPAPSIPSPPPPASSPPPGQPTEPLKKKKKTKLTPGLSLKKRGVPSLVAKWQQVQQDVRREEASEET